MNYIMHISTYLKKTLIYIYIYITIKPNRIQCSTRSQFRCSCWHFMVYSNVPILHKIPVTDRNGVHQKGWTSLR